MGRSPTPASGDSIHSNSALRGVELTRTGVLGVVGVCAEGIAGADALGEADGNGLEIGVSLTLVYY